MMALANKPITKEDYIKRVIANHLDQAFISNSNGTHTLFTFNYKDFDDLVNKMAKSVIDIMDNKD